MTLLAAEKIHLFQHHAEWINAKHPDHRTTAEIEWLKIAAKRIAELEDEV